jgi:hypothetical protein
VRRESRTTTRAAHSLALRRTARRRARRHSEAHNARVGVDTIHPRRRAGGSKKHSAASAPCSPHGQHKRRKGHASRSRRSVRHAGPGIADAPHDSFPPPHVRPQPFSFETAPGSSVTFTSVLIRIASWLPWVYARLLVNAHCSETV